MAPIKDEKKISRPPAVVKHEGRPLPSAYQYGNQDQRKILSQWKRVEPQRKVIGNNVQQKAHTTTESRFPQVSQTPGYRNTNAGQINNWNLSRHAAAIRAMVSQHPPRPQPANKGSNKKKEPSRTNDRGAIQKPKPKPQQVPQPVKKKIEKQPQEKKDKKKPINHYGPPYNVIAHLNATTKRGEERRRAIFEFQEKIFGFRPLTDADRKLLHMRTQKKADQNHYYIKLSNQTAAQWAALQPTERYLKASQKSAKKRVKNQHKDVTKEAEKQRLYQKYCEGRMTRWPREGVKELEVRSLHNRQQLDSRRQKAYEEANLKEKEEKTDRATIKQMREARAAQLKALQESGVLAAVFGPGDGDDSDAEDEDDEDYGEDYFEDEDEDMYEDDNFEVEVAPRRDEDLAQSRAERARRRALQRGFDEDGEVDNTNTLDAHPEPSVKVEKTIEVIVLDDSD